MGKNQDWKQIEDNIFRFENVGDNVSGTLLKKEIGQVFGNEVYHIRRGENDVVVVFSTMVMQSRMASVDEGKDVKIVFTGTQPSKIKGQQDLKLFDVFVKEN